MTAKARRIYVDGKPVNEHPEPFEPKVMRYERDLLLVLNKLERANDKNTGTKLTADEVAWLWMEFSHDMLDVRGRTVRALERGHSIE